VQQFGLVLFVAEAGLHAARLEGLEIGAGRNLAIGVLRRQPDFEVVGLGRREAHVAGAQSDLAVGQFEPLQHGLGVAGEFFQRGPRLRRMHHLHQFHLVELVLADHAAGVLAVAARLRAKAGRVGDELERQGIAGKNLAAHHVGHRNFGGGDQVELAAVTARHHEQVFLELGQLAGAKHAFGIDQVGRVDLGVAVLGRMQIEHELRQRAM